MYIFLYIDILNIIKYVLLIIFHYWIYQVYKITIIILYNTLKIYIYVLEFYINIIIKII